MKHTAMQYRRWSRHQRECAFARPFRGGSIDEAEAQYWEAVAEGCTCTPDLCFTCAGTKVYKGKRCPDCLETEATPA